ncbi:MAG: NAD(P)H-quinone oxidoreductase, partial [Pseudomonadota bacterium]
PGESDVMGLEAAGVIQAVGAGVEGWKTGDRVMTLLGGGGYATHAKAAAGTLMAIPDGFDMVQAAAIPEVFLTAYLNIFREAGLKPDETLLMHGGASGVGTAAIQLAKALGPSEVIVTVGSEQKAQACKALGADHAILYKQEDFAEKTLEITAKRGVNVILDHIGGAYFDKNMACLAVYGRLVIIGLMGGAKSEINIGRMMVKRQRVIGSVLRARSVREKTVLTEAFKTEALGRFATGELKPVIYDVLTLDDVVKAHELMEANANTGKIILSVDQTIS